MMERQAPASRPLWAWWKAAAIVTMVFGFTILIGFLHDPRLRHYRP